MHLVGIDLTGPSDPGHTELVRFRPRTGVLGFRARLRGAADPEIRAHVRRLAERQPVAVGLDAPLSYDLERGRRPADRALSRALRDAGLGPRAVAAPTAASMAYRTLRGLGVARLLSELAAPHPVWVVEIRHEAVLALRGAPLEALRAMRGSVDARRTLLEWMEGDECVGGVAAGRLAETSGAVAACAAALGAWRWTQGRSAWLREASPPYHPYDLAC